MIELKRCPFCGCENIIIYLESTPQLGADKYYRANCARCTAFVLGRNIEEAGMGWNTRHQPLEPMYYPPDRMIGDISIAQQFVKCQIAYNALAWKYEKMLALVKRLANTDLIHSELDIEAQNLLEEIGE